MIKQLTHKDGESLCQRWCVEDCSTARHYDPEDVPTVVGKCPKDCLICLYRERHSKDDANWTPQPSDRQYHHWYNRA